VAPTDQRAGAPDATGPTETNAEEMDSTERTRGAGASGDRPGADGPAAASRHPLTEDDRRTWAGTRTWMVGAGLVVAAVLVPVLFLGPGTDLDAGFVLRSAHDLSRHLHYQPSRPPGAPVHEAGVALLDALGGIPLANVGSLAMAGLCVMALFKLAQHSRAQHPWLTTAVVVANPWFLVAATSVADFVWALGFLLASAWALRAKRPWLAGVLAALAIGARAPTALLVAAIVVAEAGDGRAGRRRATIVGGVAAGLGALLFVPAYLAAHHSLSFARNDFRSYSLFVSAGRFAAKDLYLLGPLAAVTLLVAVPAVLRALGRWRSDWLVRFAAIGLVLSQVLFFRFPWKMGHLLPTLVCVALLVGVAVGDRTRLLYALIALQLLYGVVRIQLVTPDKPNQATSAHVQFGLEWGPLVTDIRCRAKYQHAYASSNRAVRERPWNCASPFGSSD